MSILALLLRDTLFFLSIGGWGREGTIVSRRLRMRYGVRMNERFFSL